MKLLPLLVGLLGLTSQASSDPTWPSKVDELEEIMYQLESFRARKFADTVSPCNNEASGPGRQNAAEWLRTAFHDMSTHTRYFKRGGLDASLQYELTSSENTGPGFRTTMEFMAPYMSPRASMSDLIAMGVYTSVRSCGGPAVPFRAGRIDAIKRGDTGVPQPENSALSFQQQFDRMGFTVEEMIQVTACGHTIGGVHSVDFPQIVPAGTAPDGRAPLDGTVAVFDNRIVTEYLDGTTKNPLVVGASIASGRNSDFKVFNVDRNVTMVGMREPAAFSDICKRVLQKMIDVVPPGVALTEPIVPYTVKPVALQLTLAKGGSALAFTGYIRIRTTTVPVGSIDSITITYRNRVGATSCGSAGCSFTSTVQGVSQGFDDTFAFFPIEAEIPAKTGISSFTVTITYNDREPKVFDNNGVEYPLTDAVLFQMPQSCILGSSGKMTVTAAVRNDRVAQGARALIFYKTPLSTPVPKMNNATVTLVKGDCVGDYTLFSAEYTIPGGLAYQSHVDVINGDSSDSFKSVIELGGTCQPFSNPQPCGGAIASSSSSVSLVVSSTSAGASSTLASVSSSASQSISESASSSSGLSVSSSSSTSVLETTTESARSISPSTSLVSTPTTLPSTSASTSPSISPESTPATTSGTPSASTPAASPTSAVVSSNIPSSSTTSSAGPVQSLHHREDLGEYVLISCWTEGRGIRALRGDSLVSDDMTLEVCMDYCSDYVYWGTEFGKEYPTSSEAELEDCGMLCTGDDLQYCGGPDRLELYSTTAAQPSTISTPVPIPTHVEAVDDYALVGCWTEIVGGRALKQSVKLDDGMTNEMCAEFCQDYRYFGTQYGRECYCGSHIPGDKTESAPLEDCSKVCAGDGGSYCGGNDRLELYINPDIPGGDPEQPAAAGDFVSLGCRKEPDGRRALTGKATASGSMTNEVCATFCADYEYFGTEYGSECYCGNELPEDASEVPASDCSKLCSGSVMEYCGEGFRLSVYEKKPDEIVDTSS